jgi:hypothetical protein
MQFWLWYYWSRIKTIFSKSPFIKIFKKEYKKSMRVYFSTTYDQIILAPFYKNKAGIYYEQDICSIFNLNIDDEKLGNEIMAAFNKFKYKDKNLSKEKESDWPAYKYSKAKTLKSFDEHYISMYISGANEKNITLDIECNVKKAPFCISSYIIPFAKKDEIGKKVKEMFNYSQKIEGII